MNPTRATLLFFFATWVFSPCVVAGTLSSDFPHPNTYIGNAGWKGELQIWLDVTEIPLEHDFLPFRLKFTTAPRAAMTLFGQGWWCPLLESQAIQSDRTLHVSTLGGSWWTLEKGGDEAYTSKNWEVTANVDGETIEVRSKGWVYHYNQSWIVRAIAPDGTTLDWIYKDDALAAIRKNGRDWLTVKKNGDSTIVEQGNWVFQFAKKAGRDGNSWKLTASGWRGREIQQIDESRNSKMIVRSGWLKLGSYQWETSTGKLISDGDFHYEIRQNDDGKQILHRVDREGFSEWYDFDALRGLATYKRQDGSRVQTWYFQEAGPLHQKAFRMDTLSKEFRRISSRHLEYSPAGAVVREWTEYGDAPQEFAGRIQFISAQEATRLHGEQGVLFVDSRKRAEYARGHIPDAVLLSRNSFDEDFSSLEATMRDASKIVVYCASRNCEDSSLVATRLAQAGFSQLVIFDGGWAEWWKRNR